MLTQGAIEWFLKGRDISARPLSEAQGPEEKTTTAAAVETHHDINIRTFVYKIKARDGGQAYHATLFPFTTQGSHLRKAALMRMRCTSNATCNGAKYQGHGQSNTKGLSAIGASQTYM